MKKYKFADGGRMEDVSPDDLSPEDIAEMKKQRAAERAYNKAMPEADTTYGALGRAAKIAAAASPTLGPMAEAGVAGTLAAKKLMKMGEKRKRNEGETTNPMGDTYKKGGSVSSASKRADGIAERGKTRGTTIVMCGGGYMKGK